MGGEGGGGVWGRIVPVDIIRSFVVVPVSGLKHQWKNCPECLSKQNNGAGTRQETSFFWPSAAQTSSMEQPSDLVNYCPVTLASGV